MPNDIIPYGRQFIDEEDIASVVRVLRSEFVTQGPEVETFERAVSSRVGAHHSVACSSATSALFLTYQALGVGPNTLVWTVTNTFVATSNAALALGANVDFVDIDPRTWNLSVTHLEFKLEETEAKKLPLPDIVTVVHFGGAPSDLAAIYGLSQKFGFLIIEDSSHALGAEYHGSKIGDCKFSTASVFSFHPVKMVTTGEGGVITTNDPELAAKCRELRSHGVVREPSKFVSKNRGRWYFEQQSLGLNFRITDIQCALGVSQMGKLDDFISVRNELAATYLRELDRSALTPQAILDESRSSYHLFVVRCSPSIDRDKVIQNLESHRILASVHYLPIPSHPHYRNLGFRLEDFPESAKYMNEAMTIPLYFGLGGTDQLRVIDILNSLVVE